MPKKKVRKIAEKKMSSQRFRFHYGYMPKDSDLLVLQNKKGKGTIFVRPLNILKLDPDCQENPLARNQYVGQVIMPDGTQMTLFAFHQDCEEDDPKGTLRMKHVKLF